MGKFGEVTGVEKNADNNPQKYVLNQNYPNPFNPSTTIKYSLAKPNNVTITIYNILGTKICTLINSYQTSGEHSIKWDAKDDNNNFVSSGIYIYKLETGDVNLMKKMILLK